jgi:transposase-like protein
VEFTDGFRAGMVRRMTGPYAMSASALSKEVGISQSTLSRWLREAGNVASVSKKKEHPRRAKTWTLREKLRVVLAADGLNGEELGALLRKEGIHSARLEEWRSAAELALDPRAAARAETGASRRIKELEKELARKEKALAETAARLVLRKKAAALWGEEDDDTESMSDEQSSPQSRKR